MCLSLPMEPPVGLTPKERRAMAVSRLLATKDSGGNMALAIRSARIAHLSWAKIAALLLITEEEARAWARR